jgi:hypothetical protein
MEPNLQTTPIQSTPPLTPDKHLSLLPVIIVGIIMLLLGLGGGYLLSANKNQVKQATTQTLPTTVQQVTPTHSASPTPVPSVINSPSVSPVITDNTFKVRELGIEFQIPADLKDLTYAVTNSNGVISASFSTTSLTNLDKASGGSYCNSTNAGLGIISKSSQLGHDFSDSKQIGSYYYIWNHPQATCSQNTEVINLQTKQSTELGNAFKSIQLTQ